MAYFPNLPERLRWTRAFKATTEARASTTTLADDAALVLAMAANTKYAFRLFVHYAANSTADFKYNMAGPAGLTSDQYTAISNTFNATTLNRVESARRLGTTYVYGDGVSNSGIVWLYGTVETGGTAGNLAFQWSLNTSNNPGASVYGGSYMELARVG